MIRIDAICIQKYANSKVSYSQIKQLVEDKLNEIASATSFRIIKEGTGLKVDLDHPIALPTLNKIFNAFSKNGIKVKNFEWRSTKIGKNVLGNMYIYIS